MIETSVLACSWVGSCVPPLATAVNVSMMFTLISVSGRSRPRIKYGMSYTAKVSTWECKKRKCNVHTVGNSLAYTVFGNEDINVLSATKSAFCRCVSDSFRSDKIFGRTALKYL